MHSKLQRWTDLIAALLARTYPVTFDQLAREVPAYSDALDPEHRDSVKRTFERDKDELKSFGVPIEVVAIDEESTGYRLTRKRFYLPYVSLARSQHPPVPAGYSGIPSAEFEPDELALLVEALQRLEALGDAALAADARASLSKLIFDRAALPEVPVDVLVLDADDQDRVPAARFDALAHALRKRKTVTFGYRSPSTGIAAERHVQPYGLFFVHAHWYLAALDHERAAVRNFRLSRMTGSSVNTARAQSPDYEIPATFRLREHAQSRAAWDLGDAEPLVAEVRFTGTSGAARAAASGGELVAGSAPGDGAAGETRRFHVRRLDTFARWLFSFAGEAEPVSPPALVETWRALGRATLALYGRHS